MKVWLTRSQPGADRQAAELRSAGHRVLVAPVIEIEPVAVDPPARAPAVAVFLSEHAVRFGLAVLQRQPWFAGVRVLAVGARTAALLDAAGVTVSAPDVATSEGLLALPELAPDRAGDVLLVSGVGGRELLATELARRNRRFQQLACYRRRAVARMDASVLDCDVVIAASGEGLRQAARLWLDLGGRREIPVLVPSQRVAELAVAVGLTRLHDCGGADSAAWLGGLARLQEAGVL
ncbi:MAG: uroporphyrinogen-III synthase [Pseudomonadales bacterium]